MPRGGRRQGQPGVSYGQRTDMNMDHAPEGTVGTQVKTAASASIDTPPPTAPGRDGMYPEDTPNLMGPTRNPDEPITAGLPTGPGPGPTTLKDQSAVDAQQLKAYLPALTASANMPNMPPSFVKFVQYLRNS